MKISRYMLHRILAISLAILLGALVLALWRARSDVRHDELSAAGEARLFETLYALENGPAASVDANLAQLRDLDASPYLRHLHFTLRDGDGRVLVAAAADEPSPLQRGFAYFVPGLDASRSGPVAPWLLQREDGRRFLATVATNPAGEQQEALANLAGMLGLMLVYAAAILAAVYFTSKRALAPLRSILAAIDRYERNDLAHRLPALPFAEADAIGRALNHMAGTLAATQEQRRALSLKLVSSQEDERLRIARELHDEFGQRLTALRADVGWLRHRAAEREDLREVLDGMAAQCGELHEGIRELLSRLRPIQARAFGFGASLPQLMDDLVRSWNERLGESTRFRLDYAVTREVPDEVAMAVYRMTQEALTNTVRYAHAAQVGIDVREAGNDLLWSVEDDGVGIGAQADSLQLGNGLAGMRERAWALGGDLAIEAAREDAASPGLRLHARFALPEG